MILIVGLLCLATSFLMYAVVKLYNRIVKLENTIKLINDDLNMVTYTYKNSKQIING